MKALAITETLISLQLFFSPGAFPRHARNLLSFLKSGTDKSSEWSSIPGTSSRGRPPVIAVELAAFLDHPCWAPRIARTGFLPRLVRDICILVFCINHLIVLTGKTTDRYTDIWWRFLCLISLECQHFPLPLWSQRWAAAWALFLLHRRVPPV